MLWRTAVVIAEILLLFSSFPYVKSDFRDNFMSVYYFLFNEPSTRPWNLLIFVQNWPTSVCDSWTARRPGNACRPFPKDHWTIHGIWPTERGTRGPNDCDPSRPFNLQEITSLERDLEQWWTPIQENSSRTYFWNHEWSKHGTCALPVITTQFQFFKQALDWIRAYGMTEMLRRAGITPGGQYRGTDIANAVHAAINRSPQVICYQNVVGESVLLEVRICFDKALQLVDCDGYTNCSMNQMVKYPIS